MENISEYERKYGFVTFEGKDYILTELKKPTGNVIAGVIIEMCAKALDDDGNKYNVYWLVREGSEDDFDYDIVDGVTDWDYGLGNM